MLDEALEAGCSKAPHHCSIGNYFLDSLCAVLEQRVCSWCLSMIDNGVSIRRRTTQAQKTPDQLIDKLNAYILKVRRLQKRMDYVLKNIIVIKTRYNDNLFCIFLVTSLYWGKLSGPLGLR